ncbi:MAG: Response regulator consisting of a CheY-like receiver domain and a winged-helix DNA-binding domain [Herbinix sp.]|jgi:DNA-binding response OmpR family regulator|nr:Response regulator consisting of a CheY-like receiver domain and a winged-helix DNA-binding domain [Herbinix sp.]
MKKSILIIDDDEDLAAITADLLKNYDYLVTIAHDGEEAYSLLGSNKYHLILLDINLPRETGFTFCRELRKVSSVPIIFASARTSEDDRITGFDIGGDDYLPKPYSLKELLSRVNALMRRTYGFGEEEKIYHIGDIEIRTSARMVLRKGEQIMLSLKEYDLLSFMAEHRNVALSKEKLLNEVWGTYCEVEVSTVAVHIRWLREKLESDPSTPVYIKTIWGVGYCLSDQGR